MDKQLEISFWILGRTLYWDTNQGQSGNEVVVDDQGDFDVVLCMARAHELVKQKGATEFKWL